MTLAAAALLGQIRPVLSCRGGVFVAETLVGMLQTRILAKPLTQYLPDCISMPVGRLMNASMLLRLARGLVL